jgi:hypothetical protein
MGYEGREGVSRWCEFKVTYHNLSQKTVNWPEYRPLMLIRNADGSEVGWTLGNYYRREDGWSNGIEGEPPPIPPGGAAEWTWYTAAEQSGQYCADVAIEVQGWIYYATYDIQGALTGTNVYAP